MCSYCYWLLLLVAFGVPGTVSETAVLEPMVVDVMENTSVNLTCTFNVSGTGRFVAWRRSDYPGWAYMNLLDNGTCVATGFLLLDARMYTRSCNKKKTFKLGILNVDETQHGVRWLCRSGFTIISNEAIIMVKVPVKTVEMTSPVGSIMTAEEHKFYSFTCKTSYSRPTPIVNWFIQSTENTIKINATSRDIHTLNENNFGSVTSVLNISFNRNSNGAELFCKGRNGVGKEISSRKIILNVTYAPDGGPTIHGLANDSTYKIIENVLGNLSCSISWGNPLPHLSWNCSGETVLSVIDKRAVELYLHWETKRDNDKICVCKSTHTISGIQMAIVRINVLYPPDMPKLMLLSISEKEINVSVNDSLSVSENTSFKLLCESSSRPVPFLYSWIWMGRKYNNASVKVSSLSRFDETKFACYVSNKMIPTSGLPLIGTNNSSLSINILHPPDIDQMNDTEVVEGSNVTLTCPVRAGIPNDSLVTWTRKNDGRHCSGTLLTIRNVSRKDSMIYTCTAKNTMQMTGEISKEGMNQRNTFLNVLYETTIIKFYVSKHDVNDTVTVAENQRIYFVCEMEGNPLPTGGILNHHKLDVEKYVNISAKYVRFSAAFVATCLHGGVYTCKGINELKKHSEENISLYVTCSPRPDASVQLNTVITTTENVPVVLSFTAIAYPTHINAVWTKLVRTSWITVNESEDISIYQSGLKFGLIIQDISKSDFGQYKLRIYNTVGSYEQLFSVEPLGSTTGSGTSSSNTAAFVGVGVGVCITTLIIVGSCFFVYKYLRRRKLCQQNNPRGQTDNSNGSTGYATECDHISLSNVNKMEHVTGRMETRTETKSALQYEKLNGSQTGANQYSQLPDAYIYEQIDGATRDTSVENKEKKRDFPEYINIKI